VKETLENSPLITLLSLLLLLLLPLSLINISTNSITNNTDLLHLLVPLPLGCLLRVPFLPVTRLLPLLFHQEKHPPSPSSLHPPLIQLHKASRSSLVPLLLSLPQHQLPFQEVTSHPRYPSPRLMVINNPTIL
jgi:hypothetical protein